MQHINPIPLLVLPYEILSDNRLGLRHIRTLMAIFSWRKKNSTLARISREKISERTGYPISRVSEITTDLSKLGWITKVGNGGKSQWSEYHINDLEDLPISKISPKNSNGIDQNATDTVTKSVIQNSNSYQNSNGIDQNSTDTVTETVTAGVTETVTVGVTETVTPIDTKRNTKRNYNFFKKEKTFKDFVEEKRGSVIKPTLEEVESHIFENNLLVDPNKFFDKCELHNWLMLGKPLVWKEQVMKWHLREKDKKKVHYRNLTHDEKILEDGKALENSRITVEKETRLKSVIDNISYHNHSLIRIQRALKIDGKPLVEKDIQILKEVHSCILKNSDIIDDLMLLPVLSFAKDKKTDYTPKVSNLKALVSAVLN